MQDYIIGIDIGTGSTKAIAVNLQGESFFDFQEHYPPTNTNENTNEQDPSVIWKAFIKCVQQVVSNQKRLPLAISLSSAMHSIMPVDINGKPLAKLITWADGRSADIAERLKNTTLGTELYAACGTPIHAMSPLCKIIWFAENQPELFKKTFKFISIKEFIWLRLFKEYAIDYSIASATGLFDIQDLAWNEAALKVAGIEAERLSDPVPTTYKKQTKLPEAGIHSDIDFVIGASDGCLANLGSLSLDNKSAALTIGTSGAVRVASKVPLINSAAMTFNYILDETYFVCGGAINNGGNALQWYLNDFSGNKELSADNYESYFKEVEGVEAGSNGLLFIPYLIGERAPIWDAKACGGFLGISSQHTKAYFSRAVLEGICYCLNNVLLALEEIAGQVNQLNVSGGFIHSRVWLQVLADITGKKIAVLQSEDASAMGAAYLALKAISITDNYASFNKHYAQHIINPSSQNHQIYKRYFQVFKSLYPALKNNMHQLNSLRS